MSLAADLATLARAADKSILVFDIETSPHVVEVFDVWGKVGGPSKIVAPGQMICWAAKWVGRPKVLFASDYHDGHADMVRGIHDLIDRADIVVGFNHVKFDLRHLRREFLEADLPPTRPHKDVDLYRVVKQNFAFPSSSLNYVASTLGVGSKVKHDGLALWRGCLNGDAKSWATMKRYCVGDVRLTERLYERLLPFISGHPHVRVSAAELTCNRCGSSDLEGSGSYTAAVHAYAMYRCLTCGGYVRAKHLKRIAATQGVR